MPKSKYYYAVVEPKRGKMFTYTARVEIYIKKTDARYNKMPEETVVPIPIDALNKFIKQYIPDKK